MDRRDGIAEMFGRSAMPSGEDSPLQHAEDITDLVKLAAGEQFYRAFPAQRFVRGLEPHLQGVSLQQPRRKLVDSFELIKDTETGLIGLSGSLLPAQNSLGMDSQTGSDRVYVEAHRLAIPKNLFGLGSIEKFSHTWLIVGHRTFVNTTVQSFQSFKPRGGPCAATEMAGRDRTRLAIFPVKS